MVCGLTFPLRGAAPNRDLSHSLKTARGATSTGAGWLGAQLSLVATLRFASPSQLFTIHAATPAALCSPAVVEELAVSTASRHGTDNSETSRSPIRADLFGIGPAAIHKHTGLTLYRERRDDDAKPVVYAFVPALPVSLCSPRCSAKELLEQPLRFLQTFLGEHH